MTAKLVGYMISTALHSSRNLEDKKKHKKAVLGVCWRRYCILGCAVLQDSYQRSKTGTFIPVAPKSHLLVTLLILFLMFPVQSGF